MLFFEKDACRHPYIMKQIYTTAALCSFPHTSIWFSLHIFFASPSKAIIMNMKALFSRDMGENGKEKEEEKGRITASKVIFAPVSGNVAGLFQKTVIYGEI